MKHKTCLVTGANSGLGKEIALALASQGQHVVMVCRNAEKGQAALQEIKSRSGSESVDLLIADLSSQQDIHALAKTVIEKYPALHVLINNAALVNRKKTISVDGIEMTLATNHLAPFLLTYLLLDLLLQSTPARIINISSDIHKWAKIDLDDLEFSKRNYQFMKAYAQSKLLLNVTSMELARRLKGSGITVNCVHPGAVKTSLGSGSADNWLLKLIDKTIKYFFITPEEAAKIPVQLALDSALDGQTGLYYVKDKPVRASSACYDYELAQKVWDKSEKLSVSRGKLL